MTAETQTAPKAETPRARRYKMRANAKAGTREEGPGAFAHDHVVYEGEEFFLTIPVVAIKLRDTDGKFLRNPDGSYKTRITDGLIPSWCEVLDEYPLDSAPKPIRMKNATA